jgi:DNA-binding winged helix-turn-helix (wHTH) protein
MHVVFGECEFDSGRRLVTRHGQVMPLSPKAFQLLELLLDRRPEAVAKKELIEHLWPETFVSDASLHNLVAEVRAAVGDAPRTARFIRTVPRYGYAFHGDARPASTDTASSPGHSGARLVSGSREWILSEGSNLLGRDRDCLVRIDSVTVSRHHVRIELTNREATAEDLGSKNGTLLNGQRVATQVTLKNGDHIQIGSVTLTYRILDASASTITRLG